MYKPQDDTMKKILQLFTLTLLAVLVFGNQAQAQCPNNNVLFTQYSAPTTIGASVGSEVCIYAGEYYLLNNMQAGSTYRISSCGSTNIVDTRLTVYANSGGPALAFNDDFCGTRAQLDFTPATTGNYRILLDQTGPGNTCTSTINSTECGEISITLISAGSGSEYCIPNYSAGTVNGDFINGVTIGSISNLNSGTSGGPSYNDFTNLSTQLSPSTSYSISIQNNPDFVEIVGAWIDYDQNLEFTEDELLGQIQISAGATGTINFTTPASVAAGETRLRVRSAFTIPVSGADIDACATYQFGEAEDYTVVFPSDPPGPPSDLSFSTACGISTSIQDNACPNNTLASVTVSGLGVLGTNHLIQSVDIIIEHDMAADLDIFLQGPDGQLVELSTDNGGSGADYGFFQTDNCTQFARFTMSASTPVNGGTAPFIGSFIPEGNLADFHDGGNANGIWRLRVCDDFAGDVGTIRYFRVNFESVQTQAPLCAESYNLADEAQNVSLDQQISWVAGSGQPSSYDVFFGTSATPSLASDNQTSTSFNPETLLPSTEYFYQVVPANSAGSATGCPIRSFTTADNGDVILMANGIINTCSGTFTDAGGVNGNYLNNDTLLLTIFPDQANSAVQAAFNSFELESGFDALVILDGIDENGTIVGVYLGTDSPGTVTATNPQGALTFAFISDDIINAPGWSATISCVPSTSVPTCATNLSPADLSTGVSVDANLSWSAGLGVTTAYDVYFGTSVNPPLLQADVTATSFDLPTLLNSTLYYYQIVPKNSNGTATDCPILSFTTEAAPNVILMQNGSVTACDAQFFDTGGANSDYSNGESLLLTILPDSPGNLVSITFTQFNTDPGFDLLTIYDGVDDQGTPISSLGGNSFTLPFTVTSDDPTGALTLRFSSDFQVTASGWAAQISCEENNTAPSCAADLFPVNNATGVTATPTITWSSGGGAPQSYDVYFGTDASNLPLVENNLLATTYSPTGLNLNTTYFWQIVPENNSGSAVGCPVNQFTTTPNQEILMTTDTLTVCGVSFFDDGGVNGDYAPNTLNSLTFLPENSGDFVSVEFTSFDVEEGFDALVILNGSDPENVDNIVGFYSGTELPPAFTSSAADGALTFVFISDETDNFSAGWEASITCITQPVAPGCAVNTTPTNAATDVADDVTLTWAAGTGLPTGYQVFFGTDPLNLTLVSTQSSTSYAPSGLTAGTTYYWQIIPTNEVGSATDCSVSSFTVAPEVVTDILMQNASLTVCQGAFFDSGAENGDYNSDELLTLTLTPSTPNSLLQIDFSSFDTEEDFDSLIIYNGNSTSSPILGIYQGVLDPFTVVSSAVDGSLTLVFESDGSFEFAGWEAAISCVDADAAPECASNLSPANNVTEVSVSTSLTWSTGGGATTGFDVYFGTDPLDLTLVASNIQATSYTPESLELNTAYFWQVVPRNNDQLAENCPVNTFTTEATQNIVMQNGTFTLCAADFFDSGDAASNYSNDEDLTLTFIPEIAGNVIQVSFTEYETEFEYDTLRIFNGNSTAAPILAELDGTAGVGQSYISTAIDGSLTFRFTSDFLFSELGWVASVVCVDPNAAPACATNPIPASLATGVDNSDVTLSWTASTGVVSGYNVFFGTDPLALTQVATDQVGTTYNAGDLALNTTYYWQVIAQSPNGPAEDCPVNSFTTTAVENIFMSNDTITTCGANFFDSEGPDADYLNNEDYTLTFLPATAGNVIEVTFNEFALEVSAFDGTIYDTLFVYNGSSVDAPLIGFYSGTTIPGPFTSSDVTGALTFRFSSDFTVGEAGWAASVACVEVSGAPDCAENLTPANAATDVSFVTVLNWQSGGGIVTGYDVFFGTDPLALDLVSDNQIGTTFSPGALDLNTTYYWQVIPSNNDGSAADCPVNSFTTAPTNDLVIFNGELTLCDATLFDTGGSEGDYDSGEDFELTIFPSTPGSFVQLDFTSFATEEDFDFLNVYNGNSSAGAELLEATGATLPGTIVSTSADGSLTLVFSSDGSVEDLGFEIAISCFTPAVVPGCAENYVPADLTEEVAVNAVLSWTNGTGSTTSYDVYFGTDPDALTLVSNDQTTTSFTPAGLESNTTYYWQVVPANLVGEATGCPVQSFTTGGTVDIIITNGSITTCNANFFDSGGADGVYQNNENFVYTIFPGSPNSVIQVTFTAFGGEACCDDLFIFNGNTNTAPQIGNLFGAPAMPQTFTSTAADGSLTFQFQSDISITGIGFVASVTCVDTTIAPGCASITGPADGATEVSSTTTVLSWTAGSGYTTGYDVYFGDDCDNMVLISDNQPGTTFDPGQLATSASYAWMVVPVNGAGEATGCSCNTFTTSANIDILMQNGSFTTCAANFYDSGGLTGNYSNNESSELTICPDQPNSAIQVIFTSFDVEERFNTPNNPWDWMSVYNGTGTASAPYISPTSGNERFSNNVIPGPFTSAATDGCLTFTFSSDVSVPLPGWAATVSCVSTTDAPACAVITSGPADGATDVCLNDAVFNWTAGAGSPATGYDVYFDFDGSGFVLLADDQPTTSFDPGILAPNTSYGVIIVPNNANGEAIGCDTINFTTGTCLVYCDAGSITCDEFIANVEMGGISNSSDCSTGGYSDFTNISTDVYIGTATNLTVTNGVLDYPQDQAGVWIDWNQDGDFDDADETITVNGTPGVGPYTAAITPPVGAVEGPTTMRIRITFIGIVDPCGTTNFGEVEDYTIIVNPPLACPFPNNITTSETTTTATIITWDTALDAGEYLIRYRAADAPLTEVTWTTPQVVTAPDNFTFFTDLLPCTQYVLQIASICPDEADTTFSPNVTFLTRCIECTADMTIENETCGDDLNGGCNSTPPAYQPIACGETICATSFMNPDTRDTDWYSLTVDNTGVYTVNVLAEFDGTLLFVDVADCDNLVIPSQGTFTANTPYTIATSLNPGSYAIVLVPVFEQAPFDCAGYNAYTIELSGGVTQIAPVADVCETTAPFTLFAIPSGGTWSGTGISDANAGTFDPSTAGIGSYVITYNASANGCASEDTVTINVVAAPLADFVGLAASYCPSDASAELSGIPAGGVFSINNTNNVGIDGNTFNPSLVTPGSYAITYTVNTGGACASSITQNVVVNGAPAASFVLADSTCSQDSPIALTGTPAGGVFSGPGVFAGNFDPTLSGTGAITITYTVSVPDSVCPGVATETIQVNPAPVVSLTGLASTYCLNSDVVTLAGTPALGTYSGPGVTGGTFDPAAAGVGTHTIRYEFDNGTCVGFDEVTVTVTDNLTLTFSVPASVCSDADPFLLTSSPDGAVFSGPGVNGQTFSPQVAGVGTHTITATYSNGTCSATATQTITVNPAPVASFNYSANGSTVVFSNASVNATSYSWDFGDGQTSTATNPSHTYGANGSYDITLIASSAGCGSDTFTVELELSVGIGSIDGVDMIQLYPNPTEGDVMLTFNSLASQSFEVRITDEIGRLIQVENVNNYMGKFSKVYDLSDLARGVYTFSVSSEKGAINFRVVKQ
jgi:subtilisin-like proprotein convertase family protein